MGMGFWVWGLEFCGLGLWVGGRVVGLGFGAV